MLAADVEMVWATLDAALDAVEHIDVTALDDDDVHAHVRRVHALAARVQSLCATGTGEWEARGIWADDGSKAAWARLARERSMTAGRAKLEVNRAKKLRAMPATAAAFAAGKLSVDQVDLLATAYQPALAAVFARAECMLVAELAGLRLRDGRRFVDYWIESACAEVDQERSRPDPEGRRWHVGRTFDGTVAATGTLDPIGGTEYLTELEAIERDLFEADWAAARAEHGAGALPSALPRTRAQRFADAQVEMARRSRAYAQGQYRRPEPLVTVHVGLGTLERLCELADGTVVSPHQVFPLLTRADIERVVFESPSRVIDIGERRRFFTGALRRAIEVRDRHCQHPSGCDVPAENCHVDHIVRYADGGLTVQENGRCYCPTHNRQRERNRDHDERPPPAR